LNAERLRYIETIYHAALEQTPENRSTFIQTQCSGDAETYEEVRSLIDCCDEDNKFLAQPALKAVEIFREADSEILARRPYPPIDRLSGKSVSHYRILELAGCGGMGVVYKALDKTLGRHVALKFLLNPAGNGQQLQSTNFNHSGCTLERFRDEARVCSQLDHPNICVVYEIDESEYGPFIAMQWLEGQTLDAEIGGTPLAAGRVIEIGMQLADALATAHNASILHRDIKPANIFIVQRGFAKILDFGLAKLLGDEDNPDGSGSVTGVAHAAGSGSYMAPEQLLGKRVDERSDVFSLGVVLYEMTTGRKAFRGDSLVSILSALLHDTPEQPTKICPSLPEALEKIILRAMAKEPAERYQSATELREALGRLKVELESKPKGWFGTGLPHLHRSGQALFIAVGSSLLICLVIASIMYRHRARVDKASSASQRLVVLADFDNKTGEPIFDETLKQGFRVVMEQSPYLNLLSDRSSARTLAYMGKPATQRVSGDVAREVCLRNMGSVILSGTISSLGSRYIIAVNASNCETGALIDSEQEQANTREEVLDRFNKIATAMRGKLGESLASIKEHDVPLRQVTTRSLEALRAFSLGMKAGLAGGDRAAIPLLQRAVDLDPSFAMANACLGNSYFGTGELGSANKYLSRAYALRNAVSAKEKLYIEAHYFGDSGQIEKGIATFEMWQQAFPSDPTTYVDLGVLYSLAGRQQQSLEQEMEALRRVPYDGAVYLNLATAQILLGKVDDAEATIKLAAARNVHRPVFSLLQYQLAFLKAQPEEMERQYQIALSQRQTEAWALAYRADTEAYYGRLANSRRFSRQAIDTARLQEERESVANYQAIEALHDAEFGQFPAARKEAGLALHAGPDEITQVLAALALAQAGDSTRARSITAALAAARPLDTFLNRYWIPTIHAAADIHDGNYQRALTELELTIPYESATPPTPTNVYPYPIYLRGQAYLHLERGADAAREFKKIVEHCELAMNYPLASLAQLGLARAYRLQIASSVRRTMKRQTPSSSADFRELSRSEYSKLLEIWNDPVQAESPQRQAVQELSSIGNL